MLNKTTLEEFLTSLENDTSVADGRITVEEYISLKTAIISAIKIMSKLEEEQE